MRIPHLIAFFFCVLLISLKCTSEISIKDKNEDLGELEIEFGRMLFEDNRLSIDNSISCKSCHIPELAFTDGKSLSNGVYGRKSMRNAPSLLNVGHFKKFMADAEVSSLEMQVLAPIQDPNEMGSSIKIILGKLKHDNRYQSLSQKIYKRKLDAYSITRALAAFERSLISENSKFDDFEASNYSGVLSRDELAGWKLFSAKFNCIACHKLPHFSSDEARSNGIINDSLDLGRYRVTGKIEDKYCFKVPSLRNVELTGPYMHNGSIHTLEEVIALYSSNRSNHADPLLDGVTISKEEQKQLVSFLKTLTSKSSR